MKDYLQETASQTAGPYVHIGLAPHAAGFNIFETNFSHILTNSHTEGERIVVEGRVFDGSGTPVRDVLIELWQANAAGRYNHPADQQQEKKIDADFRGWGRTCSDFDSGVWRFETIKPGAVVGRDGRMMAPHLNLWIVARGINIGLNTRMYFSDEQAANSEDPVLNLIEWETRRHSLIGKREKRGNEVVYTFDIYLQGDKETVFFDV
ncbi:protocatechuate 3,4-dioxygenase subunit alpha [Enterobacteriaceae bacterium H11S18]|uniref:protocatechuate 3,4-dioxygenase subunit alpha n=1 Tax=Dryocola clanedunensis TaxID=2925396 RepID=UPI0022F0276F|nr:protocatechuate 3,4-dioxygenase subunit alpha [Dryocola clanedunensis]MCT4706397.1 protocatechuate 3,4-dioxygenase subunit alpha [Dryocola clanedunensis]MCT4713150.1 protocatechuate 3,4-dioxygenase subunit alpha [Dryocola clanedunensis]